MGLGSRVWVVIMGFGIQGFSLRFRAQGLGPSLGLFSRFLQTRGNRGFGPEIKISVAILGLRFWG